MENKAGFYIVFIVAIVGLIGVTAMFIGSAGLGLSSNNILKSNNVNVDRAGAAIAGTGYLALDSSGRSMESSFAETSLNCKWTDWLNRDNPSGTGDWETKVDFPNVCATPSAIECQTLDGVDWKVANQTGYICNTQSGGICQNSLTNDTCLDYKVRFCCTSTIGASSGTTPTNNPTNTFVPFIIGIGDGGPSSDVNIGVNVTGQLVARGLIQTSSGGIALSIAKVFSEMDLSQLDDHVTLLIYNGAAIIVVGQHPTSSASYTTFASTLFTILSSKGVSAKIIKSSDITSANLVDLFETSQNLHPVCTDSDGGNNYYVKGIVTYGNYTLSDVCIGNSPNTYKLLNEAVCGSNGYPVMDLYTCPDGCFNGVCLQNSSMQLTLKMGETKSITFYGQTISIKLVLLDDSTGTYAVEVNGRWAHAYNLDYPLPVLDYVSIEGISYSTIQSGTQSVTLQLLRNDYALLSICVDTDNGLNYYTKGSVTSGTQVYNDFCMDSSKVLEFVCENGYHSDYLIGMKSYSYTCPNGCSNGACIIANDITSKCTDSDGGRNYYVKGTTSISTPEGNLTLNDSCYVPSIGYGKLVDSCVAGNDCQVQEHFCPTSGYLDYPDLNVEYVNCSNGCSNGACIANPNNDLTLLNYPQPFMTSQGTPDALFIVGKRAAIDDVIGITDIVASLQRYAGDNPLPTGIVKFDEDISDNDLFNRNVVIVGGMCANTAAERIYSDATGVSADCTAQDTPGVGHIQIIRNPHNTDKFVLLVHGYYSEDTTMATRVLANWQNYQEAFASTGSLCVTGTLTNMHVTSC